MELHWVEVLIYLVTLAVGWGTFRQIQRTDGERIKKLEEEFSEMHDDIRRIELSAANTPTKADFEKLSSDIQGMKILLARVEVILETHFKPESK